MPRIKFYCDTSEWVFPLALHLSCVGNDNRPWSFSISCLCFSLVFCIDEDSYQ